MPLKKRAQPSAVEFLCDARQSLLEVLRPYGVIEMVRTGRVSMARGISNGNGKTRPAARPLPAAEIGGDVSSCSV